MPRIAWISAAVIGFALASSAAGAEGPNGGDWKFDRIELRNGKTFVGLLGEETPKSIRFQCVVRKPGSPTVVIATTFAPAEVAAIARLNDRDRGQLTARLRGLDPDRKGERAWIDSLVLTPAPWRPTGKPGLAYRSEFFYLSSDADERLVRQAAVRLEQIYAAYARFLPATQSTPTPTTILLARSTAEYHTLLKQQGREPIENAAFYDPVINQIVCASDLQALEEELGRVRRRHDRISRAIEEREAAAAQLPKGEVQDRARKELNAGRREIEKLDRTNSRRFDDATRRFYRTLYHEACHAYLATFVYPPATVEVPRWLNEGLAQIFETAVVEAGELRIGHADRERLTAVKNAVRRNQLVPLGDLLKANAREFVVAHGSERQTSDRFYLASWALTFYLTFERRKLATPELAEYLAGRKSSGAEIEAFERFVGEPLARFDERFSAYLLALKVDGTTEPGAPPR